MRALALLLALAVGAVTPEIRYFRYQRPVEMPAAADGEACLALDAGVFAHSAPGLTDLRLYRGGKETPFALRQATPPETAVETVPPLNTGTRGGETVFDAEMPPGRYGSVELAIAAQNFVATVTVAGSQTQTGAETRIGSYTIFDLTRQRLGRGTMLALPDSDYRFLHFRIAGPLEPTQIEGLRVTRPAGARPRYVTVATSGAGKVEGHATLLTVEVPARVPVERIVLAPAAEPLLFSRAVRVTARPTQPSPEQPAGDEPVAVGTLTRIHGTREGRRIDEEQLELQVTAPPAEVARQWTIAVDNGDDQPLGISAARLEMVERDLCFSARGSGDAALYYGDPALSPPRYDYASLTDAAAHPAQATAGAERANPAYTPRPDDRPFTERNPWLLWVALGAVVAVLGWVTLRTARRRLGAR